MYAEVGTYSVLGIRTSRRRQQEVAFHNPEPYCTFSEKVTETRPELEAMMVTGPDFLGVV